MKSNILNKIIKKYKLVDGQKISSNLLREISLNLDIDIRDLIILLGISRKNIYKINNNKKGFLMNIKLKSDLERNNIKIEIQNLYVINAILSKKKIQNLSKLFRISEKIIIKYLDLSYKIYIRLKKSNMLTKVLNKRHHKPCIELIEEIKYKEDLTKKEIENIKIKYNKDDSEIITILGLKTKNYTNLIKGKVKKIRIDLLDYFEKENIIRELKELKNGSDTINMNDIINFKKIIKTTDILIKKAFGISNENYLKLNKNINQNIFIIDTNKKMISEMLMIELKYNPKYGERFYKMGELIKICNLKNIGLFDFIKYYSPNIRHYELNKRCIEKNKEGFWIGKNKEMSIKFLADNYDKIIKIIRILVTNFCFDNNCRELEDKFIDAAFDNITGNGYIIEKNFSFDKVLQFNIFKNKAKCAIWNCYKKTKYECVYEDNIKIISQIELEEFCYSQDDLTYEDGNTSRFLSSPLFDENQKKIMTEILDNLDQITINREVLFITISKKLKIPMNNFLQIINDIQNIFIKKFNYKIKNYIK
jgi:hypothetical protein